MSSVYWNIVYSKEADKDLINIKEYLTFYTSKEYASRYVLSIISAIDKLRIFPERYPVFPDEPWTSLGLRYFNVKSYIVFYKLIKIKSEILVVRILNKRQDVVNQLR